MEVSVTCDKCGKNILIDQKSAGLTIDCPQCGKAVYVSSAAPPKPKEISARVVAPASPPRNNPLVPSYSGPEKSEVHPSIQAGVHCLLILMAIEIVGLLLLRQNMSWALIFFYASAPFLIAALLCAVYGMCVGHVREGLLVLGGLSVIIGLSYWLIFSALATPSGEGMQQLIKPLLK
jgi:DNA-directed RNA polymerase subunit RPC12/RpoP